MIIGASNPQGIINLTPQIKERFIRYDIKFNPLEYQSYLKYKYGMPESISSHLCTLINKEKFDPDTWNYYTPRSIEKAINQIANDLISPLEDGLLPFLSQEIIAPLDFQDLLKNGESVPYLTVLKILIKNLNIV